MLVGSVGVDWLYLNYRSLLVVFGWTDYVRVTDFGCVWVDRLYLNYRSLLVVFGWTDYV